MERNEVKCKYNPGGFSQTVVSEGTIGSDRNDERSEWKATETEWREVPLPEPDGR